MLPEWASVDDLPERLPVDDFVDGNRRLITTLIRARGITIPADVDEVLQDVHWRLRRYYASRSPSDWRAVLRPVTTSAAAAFGARRWAHVTFTDLELPADHQDPCDTVVNRAEAAAAIEAVRRKSPRDAAALLGQVQGYTAEEQAEREGTTTAAINTRIARGRRVARDGSWHGVLLGWWKPGARLLGLPRHLALAAGATGAVVAAVVLPVFHPAQAGPRPGGVPMAATRSSGPRMTPQASPSVPSPAGSLANSTLPGRAWKPSSTGATPVRGNNVTPMRTVVASGQVGNPAVASTSITVQRDSGRSSPLAQLQACVAKGPSLDPHHAGCPS